MIIKINIFLKIYIYNVVVVKDMGHYDYSSQRFDGYAFVTMTKNITSDFCDKSECNIVMVVINVLYDYKCSHIFHILA
jgi:hypothetical protein